MKKLLPFIAAALLSSPQLFAGGDSGLYIGAGAGYYSAKIDATKLDGASADGDSGVGKLIAGYNIGIIPLIDVGVEANYVYLFESGGDKIDGSNVTLSGLLGVNLGPVGLFGKVGSAWWKLETKDPISASLNGNDPVYGVGASFKLGSLGLRAEYEWVDTKYIDIAYTTVSATFTF